MNLTDSVPDIDHRLLIKNRLFSKLSSNDPQKRDLYISRKLVEAHNGKIWSQNNSDGKGASLTFALPVVLSC